MISAATFKISFNNKKQKKNWADPCFNFIGMWASYYLDYLLLIVGGGLTFKEPLKNWLYRRFIFKTENWSLLCTGNNKLAILTMSQALIY